MQENIQPSWTIGAIPPGTGGGGGVHAGVLPTLTKQQLNDLHQGLAEWRSIQDVVQLTFQAFFDALRTQGEAIKGLEKSRDQFALSMRTEMSTALRSKANGADLTGRLSQIEQGLIRKADVSDMDRRALRNEVEASLHTQMSDVMALIKAKQEESVTKAWQESCERQLAALRSDVARIAASLEELKGVVVNKAGVTEMMTALAGKADATEMDQRLREKASRKLLGETLSVKADAAAVEQRLVEIRARMADLDIMMARKTDVSRTDEVSRGIERLSGRLDADIQTTSNTLTALSTKFDDALTAQATALANTQCATDKALDAVQKESKALHTELEERLGAAIVRKADTAEVARLLSETRAEVSGVRDTLSSRAPATSLAAVEAQVASLTLLPARLDALQRDVCDRMTAAAVLSAALEGKANVADVNKALVEVCSDLSSRAPVEQLDGIVARIDHISRTVTSHNLMARWLWKSGLLHAGGQVPWDVEAVNAAPAMFLWEAGMPVIVAVLPGLYRLSFAMFTNQNPVIQVLLNGEPAWTASSAAAGGVHHILDGMHSAGRVAPAVSGTEYFSLPSNARVSIIFSGDPKRTEGFMMLQKL